MPTSDTPASTASSAIGDSTDTNTTSTNTTGTSTTGTSTTGLWSDRVLGLVCLALGIWYTIEARTFDGTAFASGPVGPKTLPTGIGVLFCALAAYLTVRPSSGPTWPNAKATWQIGLVVAASYLYGKILETTGFIVASAAMAIIMGMLFKAPPRKLAPLAFLFPVVLAFIFNNWLELQLPAGWWGGL